MPEARSGAPDERVLMSENKGKIHEDGTVAPDGTRYPLVCASRRSAGIAAGSLCALIGFGPRDREVGEARLKSPTDSVQEYAAKPALFTQNRQPQARASWFPALIGTPARSRS
jgi:hypothetical protein